MGEAGALPQQPEGGAATEAETESRSAGVGDGTGGQSAAAAPSTAGASTWLSGSTASLSFLASSLSSLTVASNPASQVQYSVIQATSLQGKRFEKVILSSTMLSDHSCIACGKAIIDALTRL